MATIRKTHAELPGWLASRGGIAHRDDALRAGFAIRLIRDVVRGGRVHLVRRAWLALEDAPVDLLTAARAGGRVTCVSLARRRQWWVPEAAAAPHLHLLPGTTASGLAAAPGAVTHWTRPIAPVGRVLEATVEDALLHVAGCLDRMSALVVWESAARVERLAAESLRAVAWSSRAARELADAVTGLSDSGLETLVVVPLRRWGVAVRQQVKLAGRLVDLLVGERLVLQIDGYSHHSSSAQRTSDIAHDAELRLRGYTVLRLSYVQIVHDWPSVERVIRRALAAGLHRAA